MKNRPERLICFLVVWLTMFSCISGEGQILLKKTDLTPDFNHLWLPGSDMAKNAFEAQMWGRRRDLDQSRGVTFARSFTDQEFTIRPDISRSLISQEYSIPPDFYYIQSGFFCKREWEIEKATHIPFRFRLGSLADCDALEGKH